MYLHTYSLLSLSTKVAYGSIVWHLAVLFKKASGDHSMSTHWDALILWLSSFPLCGGNSLFGKELGTIVYSTRPPLIDIWVLSCFFFLASAYNASMNNFVHMSFHICALISLEQISRSRTLGSNSKHSWDPNRYWQNWI